MQQNVDVGDSNGIEPVKASIPCLVCRSRKVRCDKTLPDCRNCLRLGVRCPRYDIQTQSIPRREIQKSAEDIFRQSGVEKRRVGSCEQCRGSKHRCSRTRPSCRRCEVRGLSCFYQRQGERRREEEEEQEVREVKMGGVAGFRDGPGSEISLFFNGVFDTEILFSVNLPEDPTILRALVDTFFDRSHPLRCMSFIHKPTFMNSLERDSVIQDYGEPLLNVICALGAIHVYEDYCTSSGTAIEAPERNHNKPGQIWADKARREVLEEIELPTVQHIMTMVLLCDYKLRTDENSMVFMLVGLLYRAIRLLSLDDPKPLGSTTTTTSNTLSYSPDNEAAVIERESENRLVWACYFLDSFMGTAGEKNTSWKSGVTPRIHLPCADDRIMPLRLTSRHFIDEFENPDRADRLGDLDLSGFSVLVVRLRIQGLHLIRKTSRELPVSIWDPTSPFLSIIHQLDTLINHLPPHYTLSSQNIPILSQSNLLGGVFFLHFLLHAAFFDLTRISLPGFSFPLASTFRSATPEFRSRCQEICRFHAVCVTDMIRQGLMFGRRPFDDVFAADAAVEAAKVQIIYAAAVDQTEGVIRETGENLGVILPFLQFVHRGNGLSPYIRTLLPVCFLFGFRYIAEPYVDVNKDNDDPAEVTAPADVDHLSRFAPFRRAKRAVEKAKSASASKATSSRSDPSIETQTSQQMPPPPPPPPPATMITNTTSSIPSTSAVVGMGGALQTGGYDTTTATSTVSSTSSPQVAQTFVQSGFVGSPGSVVVPQSSPVVVVPGGQQQQQQGLSLEDYVRAADDMSAYLTWQTMDIPQWLNVGNMF